MTTRYAYVEGGHVQRVTDKLPENWNNVSNLYALEGDEPFLNSIGWYSIIKDLEFSYNPNTQTLAAPTYEFVDGKVYQRDGTVDNPPIDPGVTTSTLWHPIRLRRNAMMAAMSFRYERYARNERLGLPQVDDIARMDEYMQALADITNVATPSDVVWPTVYLP